MGKGLRMITESLNSLKKKATALVDAKLPETVKDNLKIRALGLFKIPVIAFLSPKVVQADDHKLVLKIPLNYRSRNHLGSMYFGALAVGADLAVGYLAFRHMEKQGGRLNLVFKDFKAEFLKRPEADVHFICDEGDGIAAMVAEALQSGERVSHGFRAYATVPSLSGNEPVCEFRLTLSMKVRSQK